MHTAASIIRLSSENIIELIKEHRNELIAQHLDDKNLREFLMNSHGISNVSPIKLEFIKRAMKELAAQQVDLSHYANLILEIRKKDFALIPVTAR